MLKKRDVCTHADIGRMMQARVVRREKKSGGRVVSGDTRPFMLMNDPLSG
mgnify:CR=1 FL=1